jgi:MFS family permease
MNSPLASESKSASGEDPVGTSAGPERTLWLQLGVICAASFVVWSGFGAILPYLPVFLQEQAHASVWLIGVVAAAYYVGTFAFAAPFGRLSDSVGRKPIIVAGVCLYAVATVLFVVGAAAVTPVAQALVAELSKESERSRAFGWLTTAQFGGLVAGPVLAWPLYSLGGGQGKWAFYTIFLFGSALSALTAIALILTIREPEHARRRRATKVKQPPYRTLVTKPVVAFLVVATTGSFAMGVFEVLWSLWLRNLGASVRFVGITWIAFSAPMLLAWVGGYLADRYSRWALMFSGYAVSALAWISYGITHNLTLFLVVNVVEGLAVAWSYPAKQGFFVQAVPSRWLGSLQGLEQTYSQAAALIGTLIAPVLYGVLSGYVITFAGVVSLLGLVFAGPTLRKEWTRLSAGDGGQESVSVTIPSRE